jgi:NAD(P)-dependent dehydrogenase (short-subunit alcohol dehydrogenase family)
MTNVSSKSTTGSFPNGEGILVTGCSSGIGRAVALHLARKGFTVFATVRKQADADQLRQLNEPNLVPVCPLDLTNHDHIPPVLDFVTRELHARGEKGLYAVVSNAGAGGIAPVELMDLDKFRTELEARILGPVALLQAFLPLIRKAHGRIVWIVTPSLMPIPYVGSIHICDFAVNCLARTLQIELKPWAISNIMIRCGAIQTAAPAKTAQELEESFKQWSPERFKLYADTLRKNQEELAKIDAKRSDPDEVGKVVYKALCSPRPRRRYQVGYLSGLAAAVEYLPQTWVDNIMERRG